MINKIYDVELQKFFSAVWLKQIFKVIDLNIKSIFSIYLSKICVYLSFPNVYKILNNVLFF